ncbi:hypothetical protein ACFSO0_13205 [Brevibacillus sp. GCM10020057]
MSKQNTNDTSSAQHKQRHRQQDDVKNNAPGYGDKKLEGPNRPST